MSEHVSPLDATFLELEEADESAHMHIGAALVFEPPPGRGAPSLEELSRRLGERLGALPRYHQRLSQPHTGGLTWPSWEEDPAFDLAAHVHRAALPAPGGERELMDWLGDYWSHRVDRHRPLWDVVLLEGLAHGRWALCTKTHHCMVDGIGSVDVGNILLDPSPEASVPPPAIPQPGPDDDARSLLGQMPGALTAAARAGASVAMHPTKLREVGTRARALAELLVRDEVVSAPASSLNQPIGTMRRFEVVRVPLEDLKAIKNALGGTVNDVVLAATTGGLRTLLLARGEEPPEHGLRAMVPVNVRTAGEHLALGNRITSLFVHLPVQDEAPLTRYARTLAEAEKLKSGNQALAGQTLLALTAQAPPAVHVVLAQSLFASRLFNVTVTNVPGPQVPLYAHGSRLVELAGLVPLAAEHGVGIAVLSYDGNVTFGLIADRDSAPDIHVLREGIEAALDDLRLLATRPVALEPLVR